MTTTTPPSGRDNACWRINAVIEVSHEGRYIGAGRDNGDEQNNPDIRRGDPTVMLSEAARGPVGETLRCAQGDISGVFLRTVPEPDGERPLAALRVTGGADDGQKRNNPAME